MARTKYTYNENRKEWYTLVYDGTLTPTGAKHRKRISSKKSSADLERKVLAFKQQRDNTDAVKTSSITFEEYAQIWLASSKASRELNTQRMYQVTLNSCFDEINAVYLLNLTHSQYQQVINSKLEHPRTCQIIDLTFKQVIKSAIRDRYLPHRALDDLTMDISLPKYHKPLKRPLNEVEKKAIMDADLDERKRAFISLLYYTGIRKGEALALTKKDFNWKKKTVSISKAWAQGQIKPYPKSDNGVRVVPIPDVAVPFIRPFAESESKYLFHGQDKPIMTDNAYRRMWESIIYHLNLVSDEPITDLTAHILRHNYCTELCYQIPTISTKMIARLMGDDEKMVIEVYSHLVEDKEKPVDAINSIFN